MSLNILYCEIVRVILWNRMKLDQYRNYHLFRDDMFSCHVASFITGRVQVTRRTVGARNMHGFGIDLTGNRAIWLVESRNLVNEFVYRSKLHHNALIGATPFMGDGVANHVFFPTVVNFYDVSGITLTAGHGWGIFHACRHELEPWVWLIYFHISCECQALLFEGTWLFPNLVWIYKNQHCD